MLGLCEVRNFTQRYSKKLGRSSFICVGACCVSRPYIHMGIGTHV